jgi:hypothetical protein
MQQFVQDKQNLGVVGTLTTFKYAIGSILKEDQLRIAFNTAHTVTFSYTSLRSSMQCSFYDATGNQKYVNCTRANYKDCARPGEDMLLHVSVQVESCGCGGKPHSEGNGTTLLQCASATQQQAREH